MRLGEIVLRHTLATGRPERYIATSRLGDGTWILTHVPDGMTDMDLGRKFYAAIVDTPSLQMMSEALMADTSAPRA